MRCGFALGGCLLLLASCGSGASSGAHQQADRANSIADSERVVSYHGVQVDVPRRWRVVDGMHTAFCGGPFIASPPAAFVGPNENGAPSCGAGFGPPAKRDGVWLLPGARPP